MAKDYEKIYDADTFQAAADLMGMKPREIKIERYFPDVLIRAKEFLEIAKAVNPELMLVSSALWRQMLNTFVYRIDTQGAKRWEKMLSIYPPAGATLASRRYEILLKINNTLPYTFRSFQNMLDATFGEGIVTQKLDANNYILHLVLSTDFYDFYDKLKTFTRATIPANLGFFLDFKVPLLEDLSDDLEANLIALKLGLNLSDSIDFGLLRYRKPGLGGADYSDPESPENYYDFTDAAVLSLEIRIPTFIEYYDPLYYNAARDFDGSQIFDGQLRGVPSYDTGIKLTTGLAAIEESTGEAADSIGDLTIKKQRRYDGVYTYDEETDYLGYDEETISF